MAETEELKTAAPPKSKLVPVLLVVNCLLVAGIGVLVLRRESPHAEAAASAEGAAKPAEAAAGESMGPSVRLSDFVVQLRDPQGERYARVSFEIEVGTEPEKSMLTAMMPKVRDAFIAYLADRTTEELRGSEGLARTKTALLEQLAQKVPGARVRALYITDLVLQ